MAKYSGIIGFANPVKTQPGICDEQIIERKYHGDILRLNRRSSNGDKLNGELDISNQISIVADGFAFENFYHIKYVSLMGAKWTVTSAEVQYPRLLLTVGGVYNG